MTFDSFEDLIEFAIEKEKEASDFYADLAQETSFSGVKEALLEMSQEEKKHQTMLENLGGLPPEQKIRAAWCSKQPGTCFLNMELKRCQWRK